MSEIIYLVHRLPYPPNKGDKIRSYNLLRHLAAQYDVHLGCFVDDSNDIGYIRDVEKYCASSCILPLRPVLARLRSLTGLAYGRPLSVPYYFNRRLMQWVQATASRDDVKAIIGYSSQMAQYAMSANYAKLQRIMDFVDVDSDKWRQYAKKSAWPMKWIYSREARRLAAYEIETTKHFDAVTFVSDMEAKLFSDRCPQMGHKVFAVSNGVDTEFFDPELEFVSPYLETAKPIVFTGMMDYWPNVDAVQWFVKSIFPVIRRQAPEAEMWVVGASPTNTVKNLESADGVRVTGRVKDVRPYLQHAAAVVAPLRIARGVQNKVLEALAMGQKVVCSPDAAAGLSNLDTAAVDVAISETSFARSVLNCIQGPEQNDMSNEARRYVLENYSWKQNLQLLDHLVNRDTSGSSGI